VRRLNLRPLPVALFVATLVAETVAVVLGWGVRPEYDTVLYAVSSVTLAGAGALIASRHPENPIGWLFCGSALFDALTGDIAQAWGVRAAQSGWPGGTIGEWIALWSWLPGALAIVLTFLLFPDGRLLRPAWLAVVIVNVAGVLLAAPGWALNTDLGSDFVKGRNPYAIAGVLPNLLRAVGMTLFLGSFVASVVPLGLRLRSATGVERQQLKLFAFTAICAVAVLSTGATLWNAAPIVRTLIPIAVMSLPIATCIAILRYRLYDIDVVISRALTYSALTALLAGTYAVSVVVIGAAVGTGSAWTTAGATLVIAGAFLPLRRRIQDVVDRRFNRTRFDAMQQMTRFLEDLHAGRAAPEDIESVLRAALVVDDLELRLRLPDSGLEVDLAGAPVVDDATRGQARWPIRHRGTIVGAVITATDLTPRGSLVPKILDTSALPVEIARLRVELRRQLDAVEASRARIVAAADDERRRIERDLHDGAQQRLVSIGLALRHAQYALGSSVDPEVDRTLDDAVAQITLAIDELRELARGLRPAQLGAGLGAALRELAHRAPIPVQVDANGHRLPADVETAAYFTACEGLTNAVKHAHATKVVLSAHRTDDTFVISVADDGIGGAVARDGSGLTGLSDRVAAQGGTLKIDSRNGNGTTLVAEFPCAS
jgi:signal transduction histidine kinase